MIYLKEKGVFLRNSYRFEVHYYGELTEEEKTLIKMVEEYHCWESFYPKGICDIFDFIRNNKIEKKGSLAKRDCYYVNRLEKRPIFRANHILLKQYLHNVPSEIQEQEGFPISGRMILRFGDQNIYIFFTQDTEEEFFKNREIVVSEEEYPAFFQGLCHKQNFDREECARNIWKMQIPVYQFYPGLILRDDIYEPGLCGVSVSEIGDNQILSFDEYFSLVVSGLSEKVVKQDMGICFFDFRKALSSIEMIKQEQGWSINHLSAPLSCQMKHSFGIWEETGWVCETIFTIDIRKKIHEVEKYINMKNDQIIIVTDPDNKEMWKNCIPNAMVLELDKFSEEFEIKNPYSVYSFIWDSLSYNAEKCHFLRFILRFLNIRERLLFLPETIVCDQERMDFFNNLFASKIFSNEIGIEKRFEVSTL